MEGVDSAPNTPRRFRGLPVAVLSGGGSVPVASSRLSRLLGLALLPREATAGLLIPGCASIHTFGMRFPIDVHFLDAQGLTLSVRHAVRPRRVERHRGARSVLELPSGAGART